MGDVMNDQCKFINGKGYHCGSYAFNLYKEQIDQGDRCDHHYWQDRAVKAEALVDAVRADEREACIKLVHEGTGEPIQTKTLFILQKERKRIEDAIRARGTT
jgi:hypothetical protein